MKKALFILLLVCIKQINAQVCFTPHTDYSTDNGPNIVLSADYNNDGNIDLVTVNGGGNDINVFLGNGTGTYSTTTTYTIATANAYAMCSGYFNADAFLDLAICPPSNAILILLNDGSGGFGPVTTFSTPYGVNGCDTNDFNGDGFTDLVTANYGSGNVTLLLGDGAGNFSTGNSYNTSAGAQAVVSRDYNGDGMADVAACNWLANNVSVMLGNGNGTMGAKVNTTVGNAPSGILSVDFNGDGKLDLATVNANSANISVLLNNGVGTFSTATNYTCDYNPGGIVSADYNGDGKLDLATSCGSTNSANVLLGNGAGSFSAAIRFATDIGPIFICSGDFNGDLKPDLATANRSSNDMSVLLNHAIPTVTITTSADSVCQGATVNLTAGGTTTYTWSTNAGGVTTNTVSLIPNTTQTYSVTGTLNGCLGMDTIKIKVNSTPTLTTNVTNTFVCMGGTATLTASGTAASYTWSGGITNGVGFTPASSNSYTVTATSSNSCTATEVVQVAVIPLPIINVNSEIICIGNTTTLTANGANTYVWSPATGLSSSTGSMVTSNPTTTTDYTITGVDANGCANAATATVTVNPNPVVTAHATATVVCMGSPLTLTGSGATNYTWTGGAINAVAFTPTASATYTVTGSDLNGCISTASVTVIVPSHVTPAICMISTDSASSYKYNVIYWANTYANADSFIVYRKDNSSGNYLRIGAVSKDSLSEFTDTAFSIGGPNGGNPEITSWNYKLAIRDTCGKLGPLSPFHQSVFFTQSASNFNFSTYVDSGIVNLPTGYALYRDNNNTGNFQLLANVATSPASDPNYNLYPNAVYRIDALGFNCNPTYRLSGNNNTYAAKVKSHSNVNNNRLAGINQITNNANQINIYPNPNNGSFVIEPQNTLYNVHCIMYDVNGKIVLSQAINGKTNIDANTLNEGVYNITIISNEGMVNKRMVIVR